MEEKKKILLVDDDEEALVFLKNILERHDFNVVITSESREALLLTKKEQPDLIILDIAMPGMDGGDVVAALEEDPAAKRIPVIFLTALMTKEEEHQEHKTMHRTIPVLAKPVDEQRLFEEIGNIFGK